MGGLAELAGSQGGTGRYSPNKGGEEGNLPKMVVQKRVHGEFESDFAVKRHVHMRVHL